MRTDYFTRAIFRTFADDTATPAKYADAAIDEAQDEVIERLERWASSAWPTVPAVTPSDGDGKAAAARSTIEWFDGGEADLVLARVPLIAATILLDDEAVLATDFTADLEIGSVRFDCAPQTGNRIVKVSYSYGFTSTPQAIKRAVMQATKSLIDSSPALGGGRIPARTRQITSERTTIDLELLDNSKLVFPWDSRASSAVQSYWDRDRPRTVGSI